MKKSKMKKKLKEYENKEHAIDRARMYLNVEIAKLEDQVKYLTGFYISKFMDRFILLCLFLVFMVGVGTLNNYVVDTRGVVFDFWSNVLHNVGFFFTILLML